MTATHFLQPYFTRRLPKRMLIGAAFGLVLISFFVSGVNNPDPNWPEYWKVRPIIVVTIAGAIGAAFADFLHLLRRQGGIYRALGIILSLVGFIVILWLGSVLGLAGTLWD